MSDTKKRAFTAAALLLFVGAAYPVYRYVRTTSAPRATEAFGDGAAGKNLAAHMRPPGSGDPSQYLVDGSGDGGVPAYGQALDAFGPGSAAGLGPAGSDPGREPAAPGAAPEANPAAGKPAAAGKKYAPAGGRLQAVHSPGQNVSQSASASSAGGRQAAPGAAGRQAPSGAAGRGKPSVKPRSSAVPKGSIAGLPLEVFSGAMTDAQSDALVARFNDGSMTTEQIDMLIGLVNSGTEFSEKHSQIFREITARDEKKLDAEMQKALNTHVVIPPDQDLKRGKFWPVKGRVSQKFGPTNWNIYAGMTYNGKYYPHFHKGLDVSAPIGSPLRSYDAGKVTYAGGTQSTGVSVIVAHPDGLATRYQHMPVGGPTVRVGQLVGAGQVIGSIGMTGLTTGPHVHFEVRRGNSVIDPLSVLP